jgi:AcrR family transcriptional regulator
MTASARTRQKADRRASLLREAARRFAERGFHGVSIEELGAAVGISGPAVYRHFPNKDAVLAALLVGVSERLLAGSREQVGAAGSPAEALRRLVAFQTDFALREPELIRVQDRDLPNLSTEAAHQVRRLQRAYVEVWVDVLCRLDAALSAPEARTRAHAAFGLLNSTPHSANARAETPRGGASRVAGGATSEDVRGVLERMALAALTVPHS